MTAVKPRVTNLVFDCADMEALAAFWGELLSLEVTSREDDWLNLEPLGQGGPRLSFQKVPEGKTVKNRLHLDLYVPDIEVAGRRASALGATPAGEPLGRPEEPFRVWYDPEGNEFCLCTDS